MICVQYAWMSMKMERNSECCHVHMVNTLGPLLLLYIIAITFPSFELYPVCI